MGLTEKISYIKGLAEGLKLQESKDEVKVLNAMMELLEEMAERVEELEEYADEMGDLIEVLDEDLGEVEDLIFDDNSDCHCDICGSSDLDDIPFDMEDDDIYEIVCPVCGETICLEEDALQDAAMQCPKCGQSLEFDFSELEENPSQE